MMIAKRKWAALCEKWFEGEVTLPKTTLWLIGTVCLLAGIVYGLRKAPWTHGVIIGSNNGNNSGNCGSCSECDAEGEEQAEA